MTGFLLDLWHDLREKRLAPVAILLLVAAVAIPVVMLKPAPEPAGPPAAAQATGAPDDQAVIKAAALEPGQGSDLGIFDPKDPFKPAAKVGARTPSGVAQPVSPAGVATDPAGGAPAADAGAAPAPSGDTGGGGGGGGGGSSPVAPAPPAPPTQRSFAYVADVTFGRTGNPRERTVRRLELLPNNRSPVVVFLGITANRSSAAFLVDSRFSQAGEGRCRPSLRTCTYVYLSRKDGENEHFFTDVDGHEYVLRLLDIRRIEIKPGAAASRAKGPAARAGASATRPRPTPLFADEMEQVGP